MTTVPPHKLLTEARKHEATRTVVLKRLKEGTSAADIYRAAIDKGKLSSRLFVPLDPDEAEQIDAKAKHLNLNVDSAIITLKQIPIFQTTLEIGDGETSLGIAERGFRSVVVLPEHLRAGWYVACIYLV